MFFLWLSWQRHLGGGGSASNLPVSNQGNEQWWVIFCPCSWAFWMIMIDYPLPQVSPSHHCTYSDVIYPLPTMPFYNFWPVHYIYGFMIKIPNNSMVFLYFADLRYNNSTFCTYLVTYTLKTCRVIMESDEVRSLDNELLL